MIDPAVIVAVASSSVKLLSGGLKLAIWDGWAAWPNQDRMTWLVRLFGEGKDVLLALGETVKPLLPAGVKPEAAVHLWAVHVACFGEALATYWAGNKDLAGRSKWGRWSAPTWVRERSKEIDAAFRFALDLLVRNPAPRLPKIDWADSPTSSPMYNALWKAFTDKGSVPDGHVLIPLDQSGDVQSFERAYVQAFREAMARSSNAELRVLLADGRPRVEALRTLLVADMASWRHQHVFAGVDTSEDIPNLPLEKTYVIPSASVSLGRTDVKKPVIELLEELLAQHKIVFVSADFGHGKSLTARTLAWRWAEAYLTPPDAPTSERTFPIHIRCHEDTVGTWDFDNAIRRALKRRADVIGVGLALGDVAFDPPPAAQRTVYLIDGLDELILTDAQTRDLVRELNDHATDLHRFIVFSRPEALPRTEAGQAKVPVVKIESFDAEQIDQWLWAWPRIGPSREELAAHQLTELATVPILLFMLALNWQPLIKQGGVIRHARIYDLFFQTLAAGKYERGGERHPQIREAADDVRTALNKRNELPPCREDAEGEQAIEAMRWMMDRVAWEARRREFCGDVLTRHHIGKVITDELGVAESTLDSVRIGLLLGMQASFGGGGERFFFGHRSFMEFAVARYWARQLRRLCRADVNEREKIEDGLDGAPLCERNSRVFLFLCDLLEDWSDEDCQRFFDWAQATVNDETIELRHPELWKEAKILVRQSALALGCRMGLRLKRPFPIGKGSVLLLISTWWQVVKRKSPLFEAPGCCVQEKATLWGLVAEFANFAGADFSGVDLFGAGLTSANLTGANLSGAKFADAELREADLSHAIIDGATFQRADLEGAKFGGEALLAASFENAFLRGAEFSGATLRQMNFIGANLVEAKLVGVNMFDTNLTQANLHGAVLRGATLQEVVLRETHLCEANLEEVKFGGSRLWGTNMRGAHLEGADLSDVEFNGTIVRRVSYDDQTRWPAGFTPDQEMIMVLSDGRTLR